MCFLSLRILSLNNFSSLIFKRLVRKIVSYSEFYSLTCDHCMGAIHWLV